MININVNSAYPSTDEVYSHELNCGGSRKIAIAFWEDSNPIDLSGKDLTATFVTNKRLIAEDVELEKINDNIAQLDISSTENYRILPGTMLVEIKIAEGNKELYPSSALVIKVRRSIIDDAEVTPESYGTVSEILQEVAEARGNFNSLGARLNNTDDKFPVDTSNIKDNAVTTNKLAGSAVTTSKIYPNAVTENKIANGSVTTDKIAVHAVTSDRIGNEEVKTVNIKDGAVGESKIASGAVTSGKLGVGAVSSAKIDTNAVTENKIANNAVTYAKLSSELQGTIDGKADLTDLDELLRYFPYTINTASQLNISGYASEYGRYGLKLVGSAANSFGVESGTLAEMKVIGVGEVSAQNPFIRVLEFPQISGLKWYQEVTSIGQTFTAGSWTRVNVRDEVVLKPNTTIGFDSNGCIAQIIKVLGTTLGAGYGSNIRAIYINSSITTVSDDVFTTAPYLKSLYIDNVPGAVTFGETIQTKIANREFSVIYRDNINLVRSLAISQKGTYERLIGLLPNYSIGFNSNGIVITRANVTDIGAGGIGNSNVRSIYVAPKVTSISSSIISATIGLTTDTLDLYVDNSQDNINIASAVLSDSRITIHYKGSFSVIDLLLNSQLQLNDRLTTFENTVGTVNTALENAINGVSE